MALSTLRDHQKQLRLNHLTFKISEIHMDSRQDNLKLHLRKLHELESTEKKGRFCCSICDSRYYHATSLAQHLDFVIFLGTINFHII